MHIFMKYRTRNADEARTPIFHPCVAVDTGDDRVILQQFTTLVCNPNDEDADEAFQESSQSYISGLNDAFSALGNNLTGSRPRIVWDDVPAE